MKFVSVFIFSLVTFITLAKEPPQEVDKFAEQYVKLVLAVGEHDPVYVDAYYGPAEWKDSVAQVAKSLQQIQQDAETLKSAISQLPPATDLDSKLRHHYLAKQLNALSFHVEQLQSKASGVKHSPSFDAETQALYDTITPKRDLAEFDVILAQLDEVVPGEGDLVTRVDNFMQKLDVPANKVDAVFQAAMDACRSRTLEHLSLPQNESFVVEYVTDKAWSGYNWYKGNAFSLIQVNVDFPISITRAVDLGCHEGYPGHHTYNALLETELANKKGYVELTVYPLFSPQSLIAEGSANYGIEMAFPGQQKAQFETSVLYPIAGLKADNAKIYNQIVKLRADLSFARNEIAREYIEGTISREEAIKLQSKYGLETLERAEQRIRFVDKYGAYVINYNWGKQLVREYIEQGNPSSQERWDRFIKLLSSPRLPSSLNWQ